MDTRVKSAKTEVNITAAPYDIYDRHQKFTWDQRSKTFRFWSNRTFALAFETEKPKYGSRAVFNLYKAKINQPKQEYNGRIQTKYSIMSFCLMFVNGQPGSYLRWEPCQNVKSQLFTFHQVGYWRKTPIGLNITKHEKDFKLVDHPAPTVLLFRGIQGPMYTFGIVGRLRKSTDEFFIVSRAYNHKDTAQQWHFDKRTKSLRLVANKHFVLSFKSGRIAYPTWATLRAWRNENLQKFFVEEGKLKAKLKSSEFCLSF